MTVKDELHRLVDALPEREAYAARRFLEYLRDSGGTRAASVAERDDSVLRAFMEAPEDDEPLTPEDEAAIQEAEAEIARGDVITWEQYRAEQRRKAGRTA